MEGLWVAGAIHRCKGLPLWSHVESLLVHTVVLYVVDKLLIQIILL